MSYNKTSTTRRKRIFFALSVLAGALQQPSIKKQFEKITQWIFQYPISTNRHTQSLENP